MDFGSEKLSVDHADISKRDIGNNRCISWAKRKNFQSGARDSPRSRTRPGTAFVYLLFNFRFDNNLLIVVI